ncbi:MAG: hypothetical protein ACRDLN_04900 [Solirubrobacteraceae bacterium]
MHFCAVHLDDACRPPDDEEVYVVVPGTTRTAIAVPLDALPHFLPLLEQAVGNDARPACPACAAEIPRLRTSTDRHPVTRG